MNVLGCLLARQLGAKKVIALIEKPEHKSMLQDIGIDLVIDPRIATINTILKSVYTKDILSLAILTNGDAQVLEMQISPKAKVIGKKIKKARLPKNTVLGAIIRKDRVIIPRGDTRIEANDRVIVFIQTDSILQLKRLFQPK